MCFSCSCLNMNIASEHPLFFRNPNWFSLSCGSTIYLTLFSSILADNQVEIQNVEMARLFPWVFTLDHHQIRNFFYIEVTVKWRRFSSPGRRFSAMSKWRSVRTNDGGLTCMCTCDTFPLAFNRRDYVVVATCDTFPIDFNRRLAGRHTWMVALHLGSLMNRCIGRRNKVL